MKSYDAIVVGAGPAGSTAARRLALAGASVLLLDKATFPRDKPCGGGVTFRADAENDLDLAPVSEREIYGVRISINMGRRFERDSETLLARMTQRSRLDAYLVEQAAAAGAEFRDGAGAREIDVQAGRATVRSNGDVYQARVLIGADGVNGLTARSLGLQPQSEVAVALEANYPADDALQEEWSRHIALDLTGIPGGYGWVFPKGDHLNVGVGGWKYTGPNLRGHLDQLARFYGFDPARLREHRGYRLPLRRDDAPVSRGAGMLAGDAAGLVDPLSGEGIWAAFVSGRVAADSARRLLTGEAHDLSGYGAALDAEVREDILASRRLQHILQRLPGFSVLMLKYNSAFWRYLQQIIRGDLTYPDLQRKLGPLRHAMNGWADREIRHHERGLAARATRSSD